ncbi:MAG: hypothetical protein K2Y31_17415 [Burkholderiales bacterium]|nr:hypothetical protein [Burkholderiales bacterium]
MSPLLITILLTGLAPVAQASTQHVNASPPDNTIHLAVEADVVVALVAQLEEAVRLSSTMTARSGALHSFARKEINKRTDQIAQLRKWCRRWFDDSCHKPDAAGQTQNTQSHGTAYASAMLANHARLLEIIEFGLGLKSRKAARDLMGRIQKEAYDELAFLEQFSGTPPARAPANRNNR